MEYLKYLITFLVGMQIGHDIQEPVIVDAKYEKAMEISLKFEKELLHKCFYDWPLTESGHLNRHELEFCGAYNAVAVLNFDLLKLRSYETNR